MKKSLPNFLISLVTILCILCVLPSSASRIATIQSKEYKIDTLRHIKIGPGTMFTSLLYSATDDSKKFRGFIVTSDMKNNDRVEYRMELGNDSTLTGETISQCAIRKTNDSECYFAGVNADFYLTWSPYVGIPNMACYMDGKIAVDDRDEATKYGHFFMDRNKYMWCDWPLQNNYFVKAGGQQISLTRINYDLFDNELVMFNEKNGHYTHTSNATEVGVALADGESWGINKSIKLKVVKAPETKGNMLIPADGAVLSAKGSRVSDISDLQVGDEITLNLNTKLGDYQISPSDLKECSGGDVVILKSGTVIYEAGRFINQRDSNNPRTMFGYTQDRSKMIWGLIDGRSAISDGCTYPEGADVMSLAGCYDAVNVDGGGSAQMFVHDLGIVNVPSDGKERAVSNGFYAVLKAPKDDNIAEIRFLDYSMTLPKYGVYTPKFYGYNQYGLLINTDVQGVKLQCASDFGAISSDGSSFNANGTGTAALTANFNGITTSIPVTIDESGEMHLKLSNVLLDTYREYPIEVQSIVNEKAIAVDPKVLTWNTADGSIAEVGVETGVLKGVVNGTTVVTGVKGAFSEQLNVTVQKPTAHKMSIDTEMNLESWVVTVSGGKSLTTEKLGEGMKVSYLGSSSRAPYLKLTKTITLWSLPDSLHLVVNPGNAQVKSTIFSIRPNGGSVVNAKVDQSLITNKDNIVNLAIKDFVDISDISIYPITLNYITLNLGTPTANEAYVVEIPKISTVYNAVQESSGVVEVGDYAKAVVYPNPLMAGTNASVRVDSKDNLIVKIYNIAGEEIESTKLDATKGIVTLPTSGLQSGIYLVKIGAQICKLIIK